MFYDAANVPHTYICRTCGKERPNNQNNLCASCEAISPVCKTCGEHWWNTIDGECEPCYFARFEPKLPYATKEGVRIEVDFERLEWFSYILRRAVANREPKTAWDAAVCIMSHFDNAYGHSQEREDERHVHSFERASTKK